MIDWQNKIDENKDVPKIERLVWKCFMYSLRLSISHGLLDRVKWEKWNG